MFCIQSRVLKKNIFLGPVVVGSSEEEGARAFKLKALRKSPWCTTKFLMTRTCVSGWGVPARVVRGTIAASHTETLLSRLNNILLPANMASASFLLQSCLSKWISGRPHSQFVCQVLIALNNKYIFQLFLLEYDTHFGKLSGDLCSGHFVRAPQAQASSLSSSTGLPFCLWSSFLNYCGLSLQSSSMSIEYGGSLFLCCY